MDKDKMIAELQAKVAELEKQLNLHKNAHHKCVEILQEKQSEPVAWMYQVIGRSKWDLGWAKPLPIDLYDFAPLYTTPQTKPLSEPFDGGTHICPSCGCKSLYKTDKSEWCVEHKCLWQSDYETKPLTEEEVNQIIKQQDWFSMSWVDMVRRIEKIIYSKLSIVPNGLTDPKSYYQGYEDGKTQTKPLSDEEITQLKAEIVAHKKTNELLAQKIEQLEKELTK